MIHAYAGGYYIYITFNSMFSCCLGFCPLLMATHRDIYSVTNGAISDITVAALSTYVLSGINGLMKVVDMWVRNWVRVMGMVW